MPVLIALLVSGLMVQEPPSAAVNACLRASPAGIDSTCVALLQIEASLVPDGLFSREARVRLDRHHAWLAETCASGRLAGRSQMSCQADADSRLARSRQARLALARVGLAPDHSAPVPGEQSVGSASEEDSFCWFGDAYAAGDGELCRPDAAEPTDDIMGDR